MERRANKIKIGNFFPFSFQGIKECTAGMDSDTWNAYLIVSNRARSVCYATRQQLFRRRAEQTVNALISTATSQLDAMKDLKVNFPPVPHLVEPDSGLLCLL